MKKSIAIAFALCCSTSALAQVGLGGGVVGTLGANGSASRFGGLGSGISTGANMRGEDLRQVGQLSGQVGADTRTVGTTAGTNAATTGKATGGIDTSVKPSGVKADANAGGGASASTPIAGGSSWGGAEAKADVATPDVKDTVRETKSTARQKLDGLEESRDKLENRTDKKVDKTLK